MDPGITAACHQMKPEFGKTRGNLDWIAAATEDAAADLLVFPELATSGYDFRSYGELSELALDLKEGVEIKRLREIAGDTRTHLVVGVPERVREGVFNSAVLIEPEGETTVYRKLHLFDREKHLFSPGDRPPRVKSTAAGRIGLMICFDWLFPETARILALDGAQIICHPANLMLAYCQRAMFARSVENGVFTLTCNRVGSESRTDRTLDFTGRSQILSNRGETLAQADSTSEQTIHARFDPRDADDKMITPSDHILNDRRGEFYRRLVE